MERKRGKIIAMCGISGSGKSKKARELLIESETPSTIISRDGIRRLIFGFNDYNIKEYYVDKNARTQMEYEVDRYSNTLIYDSLERGKNVILDETHLHYKFIKDLQYWNVPVEIIHSIVPLELALKRDSERLQSVGEDIIKKQHQKHESLIQRLENEPIDFSPKVKTRVSGEKQNIIIFDIDGTIAHKGRRNPYDMSKVDLDTKDDLVLDIMNGLIKLSLEYKSDYQVMLCSGREQKAINKTLSWLEKNNVLRPTQIPMLFRKDNDGRADWKVKEEFWDYISEHYNIIGMFDDRLQVVRRARMLGYKVLNVEHNNF